MARKIFRWKILKFFIQNLKKNFKIEVSSALKLLIIRTDILLEKDSSHVPHYGTEYNFAERSPERIFIEHFLSEQNKFLLPNEKNIFSEFLREEKT